MKIYTVHEMNGSGGTIEERVDRLVFIKDGFAIFAVISPFLWFIWHKLWLAVLVYVTALGALMTLGDLAGFGETQMGVLSMLLNIGVGLEANNIRRWFVERAGMGMIGVVSGHDLEECEYRFFSTWDDELPVVVEKSLVARLAGC